MKLGALGGLVVGAVRLVMRRRCQPVTGEASWPTIGETVAEAERASTSGGASETTDQAGDDTTSDDTPDDTASASGDSEASDDKSRDEASTSQ